MHIQESGEMYLESIYVLSQKSSSVRSIDEKAFSGCDALTIYTPYTAAPLGWKNWQKGFEGRVEWGAK